MIYLRFILLCAGSAILAACATQPVGPEASSAVAPQHIMARDLAIQRPGTWELTVLRDPGFLGGGVAALLYIDKSPVATLKPGEKLTLWLKPGYHTFGLLPKFNLLGATKLREFDYEIKQRDVTPLESASAKRVLCLFLRHIETNESNQAMHPTAGRRTASLPFMKTHPLQATLALASGG